MKLITWNVGHRKKRKPLLPALGKALTSNEPYVVVLTDYVADDSDEAFYAALATGGLEHHVLSERVQGQRQVFIAAKEPMTPGEVECCDISTATKPNWLHVRTSVLDIVGFRVPMFTKRGGRPTYWQWLIGEALPQLIGKPCVLLGDFNAAPRYRPLMHAMSAGWQIATPSGGWSFKSLTAGGEGIAIDHGLVSPHFRINKTEYVESIGDVKLAGTPTAYSDHAALIVDLDRRPE